jgi:hypothetical protein
MIFRCPFSPLGSNEYKKRKNAAYVNIIFTLTLSSRQTLALFCTKEHKRFTMQAQDNHKPKVNDSSDCISASELVRRHLQDEDHEISESDLQKVALDCNDASPAEKTMEVQVPDATSISMNTHEEVDEDDSKKEEKDVIVTPLDVLG